MYLPDSVAEGVSSTPTPQRGTCMVCNSTSDTILLLQILGFILILLLCGLFSSPLSKQRGLEPSSTTLTWYFCISIPWVLLLFLHATTKYFADPWATDHRGGENGDPWKGWKGAAVETGTRAFNVVFYLGVFVTWRVMDWVKDRVVRRCMPGRYTEDGEVNGDVDVDVQWVEGEETALRTHEINGPGVAESPEVDTGAK